MYGQVGSRDRGISQKAKLPTVYGVLPIWHICTCDGHFTQQFLKKELFGTGVTGIEYRVKEKVVRKTLEDVVGASRDDIEDVMWGDSFRDGLGSKMMEERMKGR